MTDESPPPPPPPCNVCDGSGQIAYFKGISRFVLSYIECPECNGTGLAPEPTAPSSDAAEESDSPTGSA